MRFLSAVAWSRFALHHHLNYLFLPHRLLCVCHCQHACFLHHRHPHHTKHAYFYCTLGICSHHHHLATLIHTCLTHQSHPSVEKLKSSYFLFVESPLLSFDPLYVYSEVPEKVPGKFPKFLGSSRRF